MESIKRVRKRAGLSLPEMAARTGLHREVIARVERAGTDLRVSTLAAVAKALRVPVCELFNDMRSPVEYEERYWDRRAAA